MIGFGGQSSIQDEPVLGFICLLDQRIIYRQTECGTLDTQRPLSSYRLERIAPGEHTFCVSLLLQHILIEPPIALNGQP